MKDKKEDNKEEINKELERQEVERTRQAEQLEEQRKLAGEARERAAKAEGAIEAIRVFQQTQAANGNKKEWTDDEWKAFEDQTGFTKAGITAIDKAVSAKIADSENKFEVRAREAEERAKRAESKYEEFEKVRSFESYKRDYFSKRPQFSRYEKDFDEYLSDFPNETKRDLSKLDGLFKKAETYVKGKVGETEMRRNSSGGTRFGNDENEITGNEPEAVDLSDLRSFERLTVEKILPTKEREQQLRDNRHDMKGDAGVMVNSKADWDKYKK